MSLRGHVNTKEHGSDNEDLAIINYSTRHFRYILIKRKEAQPRTKGRQEYLTILYLIIASEKLKKKNCSFEPEVHSARK